jgi:predicted nucleic acid-binding protein
MRVLVDTNVVLDYLAKREPFLKYAEAIFEACAAGKVDGCIAAHSFSNIFYILRSVFSITERRNLLLDLCRLFAVEGIDQSTVESAIKNESFDDFEDALQEACAISFGADYIITRDPSDYAQSVIPVISPEKFILLGWLSDK